jgi:hypothetical protein
MRMPSRRPPLQDYLDAIMRDPITGRSWYEIVRSIVDSMDAVKNRVAERARNDRNADT